MEEYEQFEVVVIIVHEAMLAYLGGENFLKNEIASKKSFFGKRAHNWTDPMAKVGKRELIHKVLQLFDLPSDCHVLDLCSGKGAALPLLMERAGSCGHIVAADIAIEMLQGAAAIGQLPLQANGYQLPFAESTFDLVFCMAGLAHFKDPRRALGEMVRVLKPSGEVAVLFLSCSEHINHIHQHIGGPVSNDKVPSLAQMNKWFDELGLTTRYLVNEQRRLCLSIGQKTSADQKEDELFTLLRGQLARYPQATGQDLYKAIHQSVKGSEHALSDLDGAADYLEREFANVKADDKEAIVEVIGLASPLYRVHLAAYKAKGLCPKRLFAAFAKTQDSFVQSLWTMEKVHELLETSPGSYGHLVPDDLLAIFDRQREVGYGALHHSELFRDKYKPAYRIVSPATGLLPWLSLEDIVVGTIGSS